MRERVHGWLRAMGHPANDQPNPNAAWHLTFEYPPSHRMHALAPHGSEGLVIVATGMTTWPQHRAAWAQLGEARKAELMYELQRVLNAGDADHAFEGMTGPSDFPAVIQITTPRYDDGLTLDSFARTVRDLYKVELNVHWLLRARLADAGPGPAPATH
jgi:hypothetical protein